MSVIPFNDEQLRAIINLQQHYDVWMEAEQSLAKLPYGMQWKTVNGRQYLYEIRDRAGNGASRGPRSLENEAAYDDYHTSKTDLVERAKRSAKTLEQTCRVYRALKLPLFPSQGAKILREADRRGLLGSKLMVVGTNAMIAYGQEMSGRIDGAPDETDDFDLAWLATATDIGDADIPVWSMLKAVDSTYTVNTERSFQARNADAYEVELLAAPSRRLSRKDRPAPIPLPEQEWLLLGRQISRVVVARDASPARVIAPDPRWFALQKLWMSDQEKRNPNKRSKDRAQGVALLECIHQALPTYSLTEKGFIADMPPELRPYYDRFADFGEDADAAPSWS
jgi:hypothetical protein